jgi:NAD(P)H-dependent FMN reductase
MTEPVVQIIVGSTRPGRVGSAVGEWLADAAREHGGMQVELIELADVDLPLFDEAQHPRFGQYEHEHTRRWSTTVDRADAFVFVIPEYNHGLNGAVKNAIDFLNREWRYKPAGICSYGGVSAGARAAEQLIPILTVLKVVPLAEAIPIPFIRQFVDDDGRIEPNEVMEKAAPAMFTELLRYVEAMAVLRGTAH